MGFWANLKGRKAVKLQTKGNTAEAMKAYEEAYAEGMDDPRMLLAYANLLIRSGAFEKARGLLQKAEKLPGMSGDHKTQLFVDYAVCCARMGEIDKGINLLEKQHEHQPSGLLYETLGYLYIEQGSPKAVPFNQEAVEYDDEDPISLDNLGQSYYRVENDPEKAKEWFDKAIAIKPGQIDTLWFLSRYDLENGNAEAAVEKLEDALDGRFSPLNYKTKEEIQAELDRIRTMNS